jgi:hypothetical protein
MDIQFTEIAGPSLKEVQGRRRELMAYSNLPTNDFLQRYPELLGELDDNSPIIRSAVSMLLIDLGRKVSINPQELDQATLVRARLEVPARVGRLVAETTDPSEGVMGMEALVAFPGPESLRQLEILTATLPEGELKDYAEMKRDQKFDNDRLGIR